VNVILKGLSILKKDNYRKSKEALVMIGQGKNRSAGKKVQDYKEQTLYK